MTSKISTLPASGENSSQSDQTGKYSSYNIKLILSDEEIHELPLRGEAAHRFERARLRRRNLQTEATCVAT